MIYNWVVPFVDLTRRTNNYLVVNQVVEIKRHLKNWKRELLTFSTITKRRITNRHTKSLYSLLKKFYPFGQVSYNRNRKGIYDIYTLIELSFLRYITFRKDTIKIIIEHYYPFFLLIQTHLLSCDFFFYDWTENSKITLNDETKYSLLVSPSLLC